MVSATDTDALTIASAFLVASLSIMIVIYTLQWNYFNTKGKDGSRTLAIHLKDQAKDETYDAFSLEILYIFMAMSGLFLNVAALYDVAPAAGALQVSLLVGVLFFILVYREFITSMRHLANRQYAKPLWNPLRLRRPIRWWELTRKWRFWILKRRLRQLSVDGSPARPSATGVLRRGWHEIGALKPHLEKRKVRILNMSSRVFRFLTKR